jgi:LemA protein
MRFNEAVRNYNRALRIFPVNLVARWEGFQPRAYFQAEEGAEQPPGLGFDG